MTDPGLPPLLQGPGSRAYRLQAIIGRGGFGAVYRAELVGLEGFAKTVAIKVLNKDVSQNEDLRRRLRDEARMLGLLRHRAIVHVEDLLEIDGHWALVMEYVAGADLKAVLKLGQIPTRPLSEILVEVANALQVAHDAVDPRDGTPLSFVHRDIKPANIRLTPAGEVKVLDFGVARAEFGAREAITRSLAFGSMGYLAPERFDGADSPAADVYGLAVVAWECINAETLGQLSINPRNHRMQVDEALARVEAAVDPDTAEALVPLLDGMLAYEPGDRPSAATVAEAMQELLVRADGPWLRRWAPVQVERAAMPETPLSADGEPISGGVRRRAPDSGDSMEWQRDSRGPPIPPDLKADIEKRLRESSLSRLAFGRMPEPPSEVDRSVPPEGESSLTSTRAHIERAHEGGAWEDDPSVSQEPTRWEALVVPEPEAPRALAPPTGAPRPAEPPPVVEPPPQTLIEDLVVPEVEPPPPPPRRIGVGAGLLALPLAAAAFAMVGVAALAWALWPVVFRAPEVPVPVPEPPPSAPPVAADEPPADDLDVLAAEKVASPGQKAKAPPTAPPREAKARTAAKARAPAPTGTVSVVGDYVSSALVDGNGRSFPPGRVPAGTYDLEVTFPSGRSVARSGFVRVAENATVTVQCDGTAENCR